MRSFSSIASVCREQYKTPEAEDLQFSIDNHILVGSRPGTGGVSTSEENFGEDMSITINY